MKSIIVIILCLVFVLSTVLTIVVDDRVEIKQQQQQQGTKKPQQQPIIVNKRYNVPTTIDLEKEAKKAIEEIEDQIIQSIKDSNKNTYGRANHLKPFELPVSLEEVSKEFVDDLRKFSYKVEITKLAQYSYNHSISWGKVTAANI